MRNGTEITIARRLGGWGHALKLADVPQDARHIAKRCIIDTFAVTLAGSRMPVACDVADQVIEDYRDGPCTVIGHPRGVSPTGAALANGTAAHVLDFDDTSYAGIVHGSTIVMPPLLAAAEQSGANGTQFLEAFIAASEVTYVLGQTTTNSHYMYGWWATGTLGAIGGAIGAAKLLGADADQCVTATGFAGLLANGMGALLGYTAKPILSGQAGRRALECALHAVRGQTAPADIFENGRGFLKMMNAGDHDPDPLASLGTHWRLVDPGIAVKIAPVCSAAQAAIVLVKQMIADHALDSEAIAHVRCDVTHLVNISLIHDRPQIMQEAQFSMPFAVACVLVYGELGPAQLTPETFADPALKAAMAKVEMVEAEELDGPEYQPQFPESTRVTLTMENGETHSDFLGAATGMPNNPLSDDGLSEKFRNCAGFAGWPKETADAVLAALWEIESADDLTALVRGTL